MGLLMVLLNLVLVSFLLDQVKVETKMIKQDVRRIKHLYTR